MKKLRGPQKRCSKLKGVEIMEIVEIGVERFEDLIKAETTLHLVKGMLERTGESYLAFDTIKMILGKDEGER